jgi:hypothetical protein
MDEITSVEMEIQVLSYEKNVMMVIMITMMDVVVTVN